MPTTPARDVTKPTIILIVGNISAGKTTLADSLSRVSGATRLSSDDIFRENKKDPFPELLRRVENTLAYGDSSIVDTTGSSVALQESIARHRSIGTQVFVVRLECQSTSQKTRDDIRIDRKSLGEVYWKQSLADSKLIPSNLDIATDNLTPGQVLEIVLDTLPPTSGFVTRPDRKLVTPIASKKRFFWERNT